LLRTGPTSGNRPNLSISSLLVLAALTAFGAASQAPQAQTPTACGANASSTISTDRPQVTNASTVVPCGSLQFENGFEQIGSGGRQGFDAPETSVRFGITNKTELRLGVPNYLFHDNTGAAFANGASDLLLGFKQQLGPTHEFDVSLIPSVSIPVGANAISSHGYDPSLQVPWSRSLTKVWTLAGQLSLLAPTSGRRNVTGQASMYFDRALGSVWDAYVEYSGEFQQRGGPQHTLDFGTAYKISTHQQLDLHCNFGFAATVPSHAVGIGYSVRFQAIHAKSKS
jgi:hypothetical protein